MTSEELELASLHEAGHAVAILALGGTVERVTLDFTQHAGGLHDWDGCIVAVAGAVAARQFGPRWRSMNRSLSEQDRGVFDSHRSRLGPGHDQQRAEKEATALFWTHGPAVKRMAEALRHVGSLSGAEAARLFAGNDAVVGSPAVPVASAPMASDRLEWAAFEDPDAIERLRWSALGRISGVDVPIRAHGSTRAAALSSLADTLARFHGITVKFEQAAA